MNFDEGAAALIAAGISAIISLVTLLITIRITKAQAITEAKLNVIQEIGQEKRGLLYSQLTEFYNPILSLLLVNREIFERVGPNSQFRQQGQYIEDENAEVWKQLTEKVIIPNNNQIRVIIQEKLHFIAPDDNLKPYLDFMTHASVYEIFRKSPFQAYSMFRYPKGFLEHVQERRDRLQATMIQLFNRGIE